MTKLWMKICLAALLAAGTFSPAAVGQGEAAPRPTQVLVDPVRVTLEGDADHLYAFAADEAPPLGEYWIGIMLGDLPELARQQLQLEHGLVVEDVVPDSPAAKAEIKRFDVLVQAGDKPLHEPADILKAVEAAKESELPVVLIRTGDRLTLKVTPTKRPQPQAQQASPGEAAAPSDLRKLSLKKLEEALAELKAEGGEQQLGLYFARPAVVSARYKPAELPKNMTISVTKEGDAPAKVHVKRDDKEWTTTVDKLQELPEDVRSQVEQLLGKAVHPMLVARSRALVGGPAMTVRSLPGVAPPQMMLPKPLPSQPGPAGTTARLHAYRVAEKDQGLEAKVDLILKKIDSLESKSLEQLQEEVKRLRKELDELRDK